MLLLLAAVYACIELKGFFPKGSDGRESLKAWHFELGLMGVDARDGPPRRAPGRAESAHSSKAAVVSDMRTPPLCVCFHPAPQPMRFDIPTCACAIFVFDWSFRYRNRWHEARR